MNDDNELKACIEADVAELRAEAEALSFPVEHVDLIVAAYEKGVVTAGRFVTHTMETALEVSELEKLFNKAEENQK